jgi:hypothetical protein
MAFLHPAFLWAFTALAIPVLIHLFQLRRFKRIDFTNVRLLAEVSQQTRARKKVQHWLVLLARMLALSCLVLAFAQPYLPQADSAVRAGQRAVSLYIDDSYSLDGTNPEGRLLDQARKGVQDAVMAYSATDRFQVLTGRFEGRQQMLLGRDQALEAAAQVNVGPYSRPLSKVLVRQREALAASDAPVKRAILFTDLQRSITDVDAWTNDTLVPTLIVPLEPSSADNLSLDSAWFESPVRRAYQKEALHVRIRNHGEQELVNVPLRVAIDGKQRALATFSVAGGAVVDTVLRFAGERSGRHWGDVSLNDRPVTFDDRLHFGFTVTEHLRVLLVSGNDAPTDRAIEAVFNGDSLHRFTQQSAQMLDLSALATQDLVVLNALPTIASGTLDALDAFVKAGGSLAIFPPTKADASAYQPLFQRFGGAASIRQDTARMKVDRIDLDLPFYRDVFQTMPRNVDLPWSRERWTIAPKAGSDVLLRLQGGSPFLARTQAGRGSVYLCATPLAASAGNLTQHALFATSLLRMAELSRPMGPLYHAIGAEAMIPLDGLELTGETPPHLRGPEGIDLVPELRRTPVGAQLVLHDLDMPAGAYALTAGSDTLLMLGLNTPRSESDLTCLTPAALKEQLEQRGLNTFTVLEDGAGDLSLRLNELDQGRKLWKWFILLALLFLAAEVFLIRHLR